MSWLKRLLFGAEAVTKSAGRKAKESAKDLGEDIVEKTGEVFEKAKDVTGDIGEKVYEKADDAFDKFKDFAEDLGEVVKEKSSEYFEKAKDVAEDLGEKVVEKTGDVYEKAKDVAEDLGKKVHEKTDQIKDNAKSFSERKEIEVEPSPAADDDFDALVEDTLKGSDIEKTAIPVISETVRKAADKVNLKDNSGTSVDEVIDKAKEVYGKFDEHAQKTIDKIDEKTRDVIDKIDNKVEEMLKPKQSEFAEDTLDTGKSTLEGTDDFFEKAAKYADGDYSDNPNITSQVKGETIDIEAEIIDEVKEVDEVIETGEDAFRDLDGDGDPYIDDAIISEEE
jgi:ElaB/YqjD/DUF883 family membrane-anchored ribosome-binding protein